MSILALPGPNALPCLRDMLDASTLSVLDGGVVVRENFLAPHTGLALRLGEFSLPSRLFFASIYAYLTLFNNLEHCPSLTIQVELRPYDQDPGNTLGIPVVHFDIPSNPYYTPTNVQGDLITPAAIIKALKCKNWVQVSAFVQYWILVAAEGKWYGFEEHIVPITKQLVGVPDILCERGEFVEMVREVVDGNFLEKGVEVNERGSFEVIKINGDV